jgi:hypothetical protein
LRVRDKRYLFLAMNAKYSPKEHEQCGPVHELFLAHTE